MTVNRLCDDTWDCIDGSDEGGLCGESTYSSKRDETLNSHTYSNKRDETLKLGLVVGWGPEVLRRT